MPEISPQLFKTLSDETRLGIVLLLREMGELCVCDLCTALEQSQPRSPAIWRCLGKWPVAGSQAGEMGSLSLIPAYSFWAAQVIEQAQLTAQQDDVQAIARKLASANCSSSGKSCLYLKICLYIYGFTNMRC